jgi:hypothetical protein
MALAAVSQAVDGIALRMMVENCAHVSCHTKSYRLQSAFAIRQLEIGFASVLSILLDGTAMLYAVVLLDRRIHPTCLGTLAILGGRPTSFSGS